MAAESGRNGGQSYIMIVEDSPTQAAGLKALLCEQWKEVHWCKDGAAALAEIRQARPAAVITDIEMPVINGYQLSRIVKSEESFRDIPVILLSELASPEAIPQAVDSKADCLLIKPCDQERLNATLERLLSASSGSVAGAGEGQPCDVAFERNRLRRALQFALEELGEQHKRLVAAEEELEIVRASRPV